MRTVVHLSLLAGLLLDTAALSTAQTYTDAALNPRIVTNTVATGKWSLVSLSRDAGGCQAGAITPYLQVSDGPWQQTNVGVVLPGADVNLGPQPVSGTWSWTGPNGFTSNARQIDGIPLSTGDNTFVATYTDANSCTSTESFDITVVDLPTFTLSASESSLTITQNGSGSDTIKVKDWNGFNQEVTLVASGLPRGVTASFGTNPVLTSSVLTLHASGSAALGSYAVTIKGSHGKETATTTINLTVRGN